jgi:hypothetical protein
MPHRTRTGGARPDYCPTAPVNKRLLSGQYLPGLLDAGYGLALWRAAGELLAGGIWDGTSFPPAW